MYFLINKTYMKSQDQILLEEAYTFVNESKKKAKPDFLDVDKDGDKKESMKKALKDKSEKKNEKGLEEAYQQILESKYINKKFARRYNKVTAALLKAQPGSEDYQKLKSERDDLMSILKDHGKSVSDLESLLAKKEKENPLPDSDFTPNTDQQYGDNSYTDTSDLVSTVPAGEFNEPSPVAEMPSVTQEINQ